MFVAIIGSLQSGNGGRTYAKDALANVTARERYVHSSRLMGQVRVYANLDELVVDCQFKDAKTYIVNVLYKGRPVPENGIGVAENTQDDNWYILKDLSDILPPMAVELMEADFGVKRPRT